jgi:hypothetical protein
MAASGVVHSWRVHVAVRNFDPGATVIERQLRRNAHRSSAVLI